MEISPQSRLDGIVAMMEATFPLCASLAKRWMRNTVDQDSPVAHRTLCPIFSIVPMAPSPQAPILSTQMGAKLQVDVNEEYLRILSDSAVHATSPGPEVAWFLWLRAIVSLQVKSHKRGRPSSHGIKDVPSGRFPSSLATPTGSKTAGIPPETRALRIVSLAD